MTNEEKQLLLKDLCARLPYGMLVECSSIESGESMDVLLVPSHIAEFITGSIIVKPYLRPMSSMTEEEKELMKGSVICFNELEGNSTLFDEIGLDWLNANHFDYRGLIPMGLALEAKEGTHKTE